MVFLPPPPYNPLFSNKRKSLEQCSAKVLLCNSAGQIKQKPKEVNMKVSLLKITFAVSFLLATTFAQPNISISGSIGYDRIVLDDLKDYPFGGIGFGLGIDGLIPLTDIAKFGAGTSINYGSVSASDEYGVELAISVMSLVLEPKFRLGQEEKTYADIGLNISIPLSTKATVKIPGYGTQSLDINDSDTDFGVYLFGRYNFIGAGIGKDLTGSDGAIILGATVFISLSEQLEIGPSISYSTGKNGTELYISARFEYLF
jgi:hypothetical protein